RCCPVSVRLTPEATPVGEELDATPEVAVGSVPGAHGATARNWPPGVAAAICGVTVPTQLADAARSLYCGLTRAMTCCTDVSSRRRKGAGYKPIQTASAISGANVANSRPFRSASRSVFGFSTLP